MINFRNATAALALGLTVAAMAPGGACEELRELIPARRRGRSRSKAELARGPASRRTGQNRSRAEGVARN